jgi:hypothetical protein
MTANKKRPSTTGKWPQSLRFDERYEWWKGSVRLPILQSAKINVPAPDPPGEAVDLTVRADEDGPSEGQLAAFSFLRSHEQQVLASALGAIAKWGQRTRQVYKRWHSEEELERLLPETLTAEHLRERVRLYNISIPDRENEGMAYVEYSFGCAWDREHGILVVLHKDRARFCGFTGSGW